MNLYSRTEKGGKRLLRRRVPAGSAVPRWYHYDVLTGSWRELHTTAAVALLEAERLSGKLATVAATFLAGEARA